MQSLRASSFDKGSLEQDDAELHLDMPPVDEDRWEARQQPPQHGRTRQVQLTAGNWIVDYPVPTPVANAVLPAYREQGAPKEFTHMRYSAVTCDPDDFVLENGWGIRTRHEYERPTDILIALTYYNEDRNLLTRTMHSVMLNIRDMCRKWSKRYPHMDLSLIHI